jgi:hypothetical protein
MDCGPVRWIREGESFTFTHPSLGKFIAQQEGEGSWRVTQRSGLYATGKTRGAALDAAIEKLPLNQRRKP